MTERYRSGMLPTVQTLTQRLAAGRMPLNDVLRCGSQVIDCLRHAHEEGCCHGALTPDSVILSAMGVELIPAESPADRQITAYTAPELLSGQDPDGRSDIFSLGAVLYEMFTGRRAFPGETADEIAASLESSVPEPIGDTANRSLGIELPRQRPGRTLAPRPADPHGIPDSALLRQTRPAAFGAAAARICAAVGIAALESRLHALIDQQYEEALSEVRQLSAELPLLESQLAARLDRQTAEAATALRHISAGYR
jgi:serine/threonine protein kinase